jgi:MFS transporter, DHA2 family, methylenomycin A resistance protein
MTLAMASMGFFLITLDATVVNVSVPSIGAEFDTAVAGLQWVIDAYTLMFAALLLSTGALSDRMGASRAYLIGLAGFTLSSITCGFAPNLELLIGARALQGVTAAVMLPSSLALVRQTFPDTAARARGIAIWTAAGGAAVAAGPVTGGALTALFGWRSIFFLNVPIGIVGVLGLLRTEHSAARPVPFDIGGQVTAVLWLASLTYTVIEGGSHGYGSPQVITSMALSVTALVAFLVVESRIARPVVPLGLFRFPVVSVCAAVGFILNFTTYGLIFMMSLYLQQVLHEPPLTVGLMFLPMTGVITVVNLLAGRLTNRYGPKLPIVLGQTILALGLAGMSLVDESTPTAVLLALLVPVGVGAGTTVPPITAALLDAIDPASAGLASGVLNAGRQVGGAIGYALFGALIAGSAGFIAGMHLSLAIGVTCLLITILGSALLLRSPATGVAYAAEGLRDLRRGRGDLERSDRGGPGEHRSRRPADGGFA